MTMRSPAHAILWEIWRLTRVEAAWKLAFGVVGGLAVLALSAAFSPAGDPRLSEDIRDNGAALAMILLVLPHMVGWPLLARLNGGRTGFPLYLYYTRPVRTAVVVVLPMLYLTALSATIYLVSALVLRTASGLPFPLLPVAAWVAALTTIFVAATWATRDARIQALVSVFAGMRAFTLAMERLTAVEIPGGYDWPPRLWPALFDFPSTDYAWVALIGLVSVGITVAMVARQRRGEALLGALRSSGAASESTGSAHRGLWTRLATVFRLPCPTSSPTRAQVWLDLTSNGLPVLAIGVTFAIVILLLSAVANPIDTAFADEIRASLSCSNRDCFFARAWPPLLTPLALLLVLGLAGNAFGIRGKQGRAHLSAFEAAHAHGTTRLAVIKVLVKSACVLAALAAIGVSVWLSIPLLGDAVFIQMWDAPVSTQMAGVNGALAALSGYELLSLLVVAVVCVVLWVGALAVFGAIRTRYSRRVNLAASALLLAGLALALMALAARNGMVSPSVFGALFTAARWTVLGALAGVTVYAFWRGVAERVLTIRYAGGAAALSVVFGAAWSTALHVAGVQVWEMSPTNAVSVVSPALLPLMTGVLAPWSLSRVRHT